MISSWFGLLGICWGWAWWRHTDPAVQSGFPCYWNYTVTSTAMKTWKTNKKIAKFTVIPSSENVTSTFMAKIKCVKMRWRVRSSFRVSWSVLSPTLCAGIHGVNWPNCAISRQMCSLFATVKLIWHRWINFTKLRLWSSWFVVVIVEPIVIHAYWPFAPQKIVCISNWSHFHSSLFIILLLLLGRPCLKSLMLRRLKSDLDEIWHDYLSSSSTKYASIDGVDVLIQRPAPVCRVPAHRPPAGCLPFAAVGRMLTNIPTNGHTHTNKHNGSQYLPAEVIGLISDKKKTYSGADQSWQIMQ